MQKLIIILISIFIITLYGCSGETENNSSPKLSQKTLFNKKYMKIKDFYIGMSGDDALKLVNDKYLDIFKPLRFSIVKDNYTNRKYITEERLLWYDKFMELPHEESYDETNHDTIISFKSAIMISDGIYWGKHSIGHDIISQKPNITLDVNGNVTSFKFSLFVECDKLFNTPVINDPEEFMLSFIKAYDIPELKHNHMDGYTYIAPEGIQISFDMGDLIVKKASHSGNPNFN